VSACLLVEGVLVWFRCSNTLLPAGTSGEATGRLRLHNYHQSQARRVKAGSVRPRTCIGVAEAICVRDQQALRTSRQPRKYRRCGLQTDSAQNKIIRAQAASSDAEDSSDFRPYAPASPSARSNFWHAQARDTTSKSLPKQMTSPDDFLTGQSRPISPSQESAEALRRSRDLADAVQSQLSDAHQPSVGREMDYEDLLARDFVSVQDDVDQMVDQARPGVFPVGNEPSQASPFSPASTSANHDSPRESPRPGHIAHFKALMQNVLKDAYNIADQIFQFAIPILIGAVALYIVWQFLRDTRGFIRSLTRLHTWVIVSGLAVMLLVTPQTPKANGLLRFLDTSNLFANYGQAKRTLSVATWSSIAIFFVLVFFAGFA